MFSMVKERLTPFWKTLALLPTSAPLKLHLVFMASLAVTTGSSILSPGLAEIVSGSFSLKEGDFLLFFLAAVSFLIIPRMSEMPHSNEIFSYSRGLAPYQ